METSEALIAVNLGERMVAWTRIEEVTHSLNICILKVDKIIKRLGTENIKCWELGVKINTEF